MITMSKQNKVYAFFINENFYGVCDTWDNCKVLVNGNKAKYKSFPDRKTAGLFLKECAHAKEKA